MGDQDEFIPQERNWEQWFAWKPVRVNGQLTFLKTIYRRWAWTGMVDHYENFYQLYTWEYGTILDVLRDIK